MTGVFADCGLQCEECGELWVIYLKPISLENLTGHLATKKAPD